MRRLLAVAGVALAGCMQVDSGRFNELTSFRVTVKGVYAPGTSNPLPVITTCALRFNGQASVPQDQRGTPGCEYEIPRGEMETEVEAIALSIDGTRLNSFNGPVALRVVPGEVVGSYDDRTGMAVAGEVRGMDGGALRVRSIHSYGQVRVWVEDGPPRPIFDAGAVVQDPRLEDPTCALPSSARPCTRRTVATGVSDVVYFDDPTLQSLQIPTGLDNTDRGSQFTGEFVTVGRNPESGSVVTQSCADDPARDGQPVLMVVTGLDPAGFFVTDISACRIPETSPGNGVLELPEPCLATRPDGTAAPIDEVPGATEGTCAISRRACTAADRSQCRPYHPGTFGSMYVYNFNFPDGLDEGDLLFTLSGSMQEFTSTTQITFPAWSIAEKVRLLPVFEWGKWLRFVPPVPLTQRICGGRDQAPAFYTDQLCGIASNNLKLESLESTLVKVKNVRFPEEFEGCDFNSNGETPCYVGFGGTWNACGPGESASDTRERECTVACTLGQGRHAGKVCSEKTQFTGFGQFVIELSPPGLAAAGLDESLPARVFKAPLAAGGPAVRAIHASFTAGAELALSCDTDATFRVGDGTVVATATDTALAGRTWRRVTLAAGESAVSFFPTGAAGTCAAAVNTHLRLLLITKDAVPELEVDCRVDDPDADAAEQCRALRGATFDIVGHLRHVQPARPRWLMTPRDPSDVCCRPGPGLQCPRPIARCSD